MELSTEDKQRIEQEAKRVWKDFDNQDRIIPDLLIDMGIYATLFERAQLAEEIRQQRNKVITEILEKVGTHDYDVDGNHTAIKVIELRKYLNSLKTK